MAKSKLKEMPDFCDDNDAIMAVSPVNTMSHLKYLRKKNGYTLEALSKVTSISISYLSRLESGSRRLNTDLIRRLSSAFGCDPSELLQDTQHDGRYSGRSVVVSKARAAGLLKQYNVANRSTNEQWKDVPVYTLTKESTDSGDMVMLLRTSPVDWRYRPVELIGKDVFAIKSGTYFKPYFSDTAILFLSGNRSFAPENTVVVAREGEDISLKKVWSVTPNGIQVCEYNKIEGLKNGTVPASELIDISMDEIREIYKVVGFADFDV